MCNGIPKKIEGTVSLTKVIVVLILLCGLKFIDKNEMSNLITVTCLKLIKFALAYFILQHVNSLPR